MKPGLALRPGTVWDAPVPERKAWVVAAAAPGDEAVRGLLVKLGIKPGMTVQQVGDDDDSDVSFSAAAATTAGSALVDYDYDDVVDAVLLWHREDDGDLVDALVDAVVPLTEDGIIILLTPKPGRDGHVPADEIAEAVPTAGLQATSTVSAGPHWQGTRLVAPKGPRR